MNEDIQSRYQQAQTLSQGQFSTNIIKNDVILPHWINNSESFWYVRSGENGREFILANAKDATKVMAFDHGILADQLNTATGKKVDSNDLPLKDLTVTLLPTTIRFQAFDKFWIFDTDQSRLEEDEPEGESQNKLHYAGDGMVPFVLDMHGLPEALTSPDGKLSVFVRDFNLWVRDEATGKDVALTTNGTAEQGYGVAPNGLDTAVQGCWSPDSKRLLVVQLNTEGETERPVTYLAPEDGSLNPQVARLKLGYPGDEQVNEYRLFWIEIETGQVHQVDYPGLSPIPSCGVSFWGFFTNGQGWWSSDCRRAFFAHSTRTGSRVQVVELDTETGNTRILFEETADCLVNLSSDFMDYPLLLPLLESNELIWYSERSGWGQLYLYDLTTGELKHQITGESRLCGGGWLVRGILHFDQNKRELLIQTAGRDPEINPYYRDICKVNIDTCEFTTLVSDNIDHMVSHPRHPIVLGLREKSPALVVHGAVNGVSPNGEFIVTSRSRVDTPPATVLFDRNGREIMLVETADVSNLPEGWVWPEPVMMKDAEGEKDIYGVIYRPPNFSADKSYPVIDYAWTMRGCGTVPVGSFHWDPMLGYTYTLSTALAALGFIVVSIEGRGTPQRGKQFQEYYAGDLAGEHVLDDHVAGIKQLAKRYPSMDLTRVGIVAAEQSSFAVYGAVHHSDFFKAAVQHCFSDSRYMQANATEMYFDFPIEIDAQAEERVDKELSKSRYIDDFVESLDAKLLLITGMLSTAVGSTFRLVDALQKANKDFDMICMPNMFHQMTSYTIRREWDYMVKHLQGIEPPKEFSLTVGEFMVEDRPEPSKSEFVEMIGGTADEKQPA